MTLEVVHDHKYNAPPQRRPKGHAAIRGTKMGNKKRSLRTRSSLVDEKDGSDEEDEEDECP